ncbi:hypothetical protein GH733_019073 [Mirounga leonina]|nr:hypothetical protein GH733_019073 [Mirounga leonina]
MLKIVDIKYKHLDPEIFMKTSKGLPEIGLLIPLLSVIFMNGNYTTEEEILEFLNIVGINAGGKAQAENCKMKIMEVWAKVNNSVPVSSSPSMKKLREMRKRELELELQPRLAVLLCPGKITKLCPVAFPVPNSVGTSLPLLFKLRLKRGPGKCLLPHAILRSCQAMTK